MRALVISSTLAMAGACGSPSVDDWSGRWNQPAGRWEYVCRSGGSERSGFVDENTTSRYWDIAANGANIDVVTETGSSWSYTVDGDTGTIVPGDFSGGALADEYGSTVTTIRETVKLEDADLIRNDVYYEFTNDGEECTEQQVITLTRTE